MFTCCWLRRCRLRRGTRAGAVDLCGEHGITSDVKVIHVGGVNEDHERMLRANAQDRFVIDVTSLPAA